MLHIATVHWASPRWVEIQTRELRRHLSVPYRTWTSLEGIDASYGRHFDEVIDQVGAHAGKLNHLALEIMHEAERDDLVMFLDGDAFPIADPMPLIDRALGEAALVAVRRAENGDDKQPHPSFCVTTLETWRSLPGDWSMGYRWEMSDGRKPSDLGANVLRALELSGTPWVDILRTNPITIDPLYFAIYGETIYHHGSGFRRGGASRAAYDTRPKPLPVPIALRGAVRPIERARDFSWKARTRGPQLREANRVYRMIRDDDPAWIGYVGGPVAQRRSA
jgi:hypothetical protein